MYYFIGIIQLILLAILLFKWYQKSGLSIFVDAIKLMIILWLVNIALYNLKLSSYYNPNLIINIIVILICIVFLFGSRKNFLKEEDILLSMEKMKSDKDNYLIYSMIINLVFIIAFITFWVNVKKYGLAILSQNKINKQQMDHYSAYIVYMLVLCAQTKYILFRINKKILDLLVFLLSIGTLVLTLNRGPIAFILAAMYIYELFSLVKVKNLISKKRLYIIYFTLILAFIVFLQFFGYIGDMRMEYVLEHVYNRTINEHYGMNQIIPTGFLWAYIYLTSPLENATFSLMNQNVQLTYFNNLLYPFIKFFANILGFGEDYKIWLTEKVSYVPYLDKKIGLNVSSFIPEAMQDFGYIGVVVYVLIFLLLSYLSIKMIKSRKLTAIGSTIIYANVLNMLLWSVFGNSLKIPVLILNIFFILFIELLISKGVFNYILKKIRG